MKIHNTLTRRVEELQPLTPGHVRLYTCGPTVYDFAHIGNFRTYVWEDLLRRTLKLLGFDHEKLSYRFQGRDYRLTDVHGHVVKDLLA